MTVSAIRKIVGEHWPKAEALNPTYEGPLSPASLDACVLALEAHSEASHGQLLTNLEGPVLALRARCDEAETTLDACRTIGSAYKDRCEQLESELQKCAEMNSINEAQYLMWNERAKQLEKILEDVAKLESTVGYCDEQRAQIELLKALARAALCNRLRR